MIIKNIEVFLKKAPSKEILQAVHNKIINTDLNYRIVKHWVRVWLEDRDRRRLEYKALIKILKK